MEFKELCRRRRTVRFYQKKTVALEHLTGLIDLARRVPSASNNQILRYTIVRDPDLVQAAKFCQRPLGAHREKLARPRI